MKNIESISRESWRGLGQLYGKYIFVMGIFAVFVFYNIAVVPKEVSKSAKPSSSHSVAPVGQVEWNVSTENPEKIFSGVLQGLSGDWYRMSVSTAASRSARLDVSLPSVWGEDVSIGSLDIAPNDSFRYHEIVFEVPQGKFSDVKLVLREEEARESWSYTGVRVEEFSLSRLNVKNKLEADRLIPTIAGTIEHEVKTLDVRLGQKSNTVFAGDFIAEADFIESIRINAREKSKGSYVLEIREKTIGGLENKNISLKKVILKPGDIGEEMDESSNQSIAFPVRLIRGKEYSLMLTGEEGAAKNISLSPLRGMEKEDGSSDEKSIVALASGRYVSLNGSTLLSGAKIEDFGDDVVYTYALSGGVNDLFDVFATEGKVKFDAKKKIVTGEQKQRTSFTYRFSTIYPFEKFILSARQSGDGEKEVKLEYSFDNAFWQEVPFTQIEGEPQVFSLILSGMDSQDTVYVRASYNGEDKKTGSFGLEQLSVRAQLTRK